MSINPAKAGCLLFYGATLVSLFITLPMGIGSFLQIVTLLLLVAHTIEIPIAWRHIKLYQGPLAMSVFYTLLFGFVHWLPLKKQAEAQQKA